MWVVSALYEALRRDGMTQGFSEGEIDGAQASLDLQPSNSPYWDTRAGQDDLEVIQSIGLTANTTEAARRRVHARAMREAHDEVYGS